MTIRRQSCDKVSAKLDPHIQGSVDGVNQTGAGQTLGGINAGTQGFADKTNAWTNGQREAQADKAKGQVWDPKGITGALQGDKNGNLGVNLDNSKMLQEREEKQTAEREAKANAELEAKVNIGQETTVEPEASTKIEQESKVEPETQLEEASSKESESERDPEQERYEAYWHSKEGPDGDLPPDMTREDYERYQLALAKVDVGVALISQEKIEISEDPTKASLSEGHDETAGALNEREIFLKLIRELPENPDVLLMRGWKEITSPKNEGHGRDFKNIATGLTVRFDKGVPGANGFKAMDHYHVENPYTTSKRDKYLDIDGNSVPNGSSKSHIIKRKSI